VKEDNAFDASGYQNQPRNLDQQKKKVIRKQYEPT
jgi:hypothetical protein